jgi:DNA topoisomerase-3
MEFDFGQSDAGGDSDEVIDFSAAEAVGACPRCQSRVYEHGMSYVCEKSVGAARSCDFRSGKVILQQPIERAQMVKLLSEGRTDLLDAFVSSRTRRRFKAFLVRQPDGKVGFEFQAAAPKSPAAAAAAAEKAKSKAAAAAAAAGSSDGEPNDSVAASASKKTAVASKTAAKSAPKSAPKTASKAAPKPAPKPATKPAAKKAAAPRARKAT